MSSQRNNGAIGLAGILFVVFLILKLTSYIDWSWWWVTSPLWLPFTITIVILLLIVGIGKLIK